MNTQDTHISGRSIWITTVASMEQIIGAVLSTVVGVMIPMINIIHRPEYSSFLQGFIGAAGLIGIGVGSAVIGSLSDKQGYLSWFRLCPAIMLVASLWIWLMPNITVLILGLFLVGVGVGGGYSLDSSYISELLPKQWSGFMVGVAKASSGLGFVGGALVAYVILILDPNPHIWNSLALIFAVLALITLLMRIRWWESPLWLMDHGRDEQALADMRHFYGPEATLPQPEKTAAAQPGSWIDLFKGDNLKRVIFSGIPWACEGLGVYGIGVFLPILVMALGMENPLLAGMDKVTQSVLSTAIINAFVLVGFIAGLFVVNRLNHTWMLTWGFVVSAIGLGVLLCAYLLHWPAWMMLLGFIIFEIFLNAGPHLITYIIPTEVFDIENRAAGSGIAALLGKVGAIVGVFLMPLLLSWGGIPLVMIVSSVVMIIGALISVIYGKILKLI